MKSEETQSSVAAYNAAAVVLTSEIEAILELLVTKIRSVFRSHYSDGTTKAVVSSQFSTQNPEYSLTIVVTDDGASGIIGNLYVAVTINTAIKGSNTQVFRTQYLETEGNQISDSGAIPGLSDQARALLFLNEIWGTWSAATAFPTNNHSISK